MPLSVKSAERRTGYQIIPLYGPGDGDLAQTGWVARDKGLEVVRCYAKESKDGLIREGALLAALNKLCNEVYRIHCAIVAQRQEHRCLFCGERKPLETHHVKFRSHGRVDEVTNLVAVCRPCHNKQHGTKL